MRSRRSHTRPDDRYDKEKDDFERQMDGVSRLPGRDRLVEEAVVGAPRGATVRERPARGGRAGGTDSAPERSRIEIGSVAGLNRGQADKLRRGRIAIETKLDLHGCSREEAAGRVAAFLDRSYRSGLRCVLVVTGRGTGVLRGALEGWMNQPATRPLVLACVPARERHGGQGAFYVLLSRRRDA